MIISSINPYKLISFRGEKDENQPLSESLKTIFRENTEPKSRQRLLWELSEVPGFYDSTKSYTKQELLEIADLFESQKTNILRMALDGDVQTIKKSKNGPPKINPLLSLRDFIKHNQNLPAQEKESLVDFLKKHFIGQVEEDALEQFFDTKEYPKGIRYLRDVGENGQVRFLRLCDEIAAYKSFLTALAKGSLLDDDDMDVIFERDIEKRTGPKIKGFCYSSINPKDVEEEYAVKYPEIYMAIEENPNVPVEIRDMVAELRKIPYFKNLTRHSYPQHLLRLVKLNFLSDDLLTKILNNTSQLEIRNPINGEYVKYPIVDIGKILSDIKSGKITDKNVVDILHNNSPALELCGLYIAMKDKTKGEDIKKIDIKRFGNSLGCRATVATGESYMASFPGQEDWDAKLLAKLDTLPFKRATLIIDAQT